MRSPNPRHLATLLASILSSLIYGAETSPSATPAPLTTRMINSAFQDTNSSLLDLSVKQQGNLNVITIDFRNQRFTLDNSVQLNNLFEIPKIKNAQGVPLSVRLKNLNVRCQIAAGHSSSATPQNASTSENVSSETSSDESAPGDYYNLFDPTVDFPDPDSVSYKIANAAPDFKSEGPIQLFPVFDLSTLPKQPDVSISFENLNIVGNRSCDGIVVNGNYNKILIKDSSMLSPHRFFFADIRNRSDDERNQGNALEGVSLRLISGDAKYAYSERMAVGIFSQAKKTLLTQSNTDYLRYSLFSTSEHNVVTDNHLCQGANSMSLGGGITPALYLKNGLQNGSTIEGNYIDNSHIVWSSNDNTLSGLSITDNYMITHALGYEADKHQPKLNWVTRNPSGEKSAKPFAWLRLKYPQNSSKRNLEKFRFTRNITYVGMIPSDAEGSKTYVGKNADSFRPHRKYQFIAEDQEGQSSAKDQGQSIANLRNVWINKNSGTFYDGCSDKCKVKYTFESLEYPVSLSIALNKAVQPPAGTPPKYEYSFPLKNLSLPFDCTPSKLDKLTLFSTVPGEASPIFDHAKNRILLSFQKQRNSADTLNARLKCEE